MTRPACSACHPRRQFLGRMFGVAALSLCQVSHGSDGAAAKDITEFLASARREGETILGMKEEDNNLWAETIGKWMGGVTSLWKQYPVQSTADMFVKHLVESDDVGFLVTSMALSPYCYQFMTPASTESGPLPKAVVALIPMEEMFSRSVSSELFKNDKFAKRHLHYTFWAGFVSERNYWLHVLSLKDTLTPPDPRPWWHRRNFLTLLAATGRLELRDRHTLERLLEGFPEWRQWMIDHAWYLVFSAELGHWTTAERKGVPLKPHNDYIEMPPCVRPKLPTPTWMGSCNMNPRVFEDIS